MGFRTTKLGERVSVDTRKMSNGESELLNLTKILSHILLIIH